MLSKYSNLSADKLVNIYGGKRKGHVTIHFWGWLKGKIGGSFY